MAQIIGAVLRLRRAVRQCLAGLESQFSLAECPGASKESRAAPGGVARLQYYVPGFVVPIFWAFM